MASILRQIVAGPRAPHPEANLDLCYVTDKIIATSGPGATYPQVAYRNPLKDLVKFLDSKHADQWAIWEFRAEGTGYPDSEVYNRVWHYPWPDHHPPPFALIPLIMGSMRNWLKEKDAPPNRVIVVHCKAGKGRSGTVACSYLISEEGWAPGDATKRFTERRMRPGFGVGISIPSQQRWITYVDRWTQNGKLYVERPVEVLEVHVWGLRAGVKIAVEGYVDEGKKIKKFHTFGSKERVNVNGSVSRSDTSFVGSALEAFGRKRPSKDDTGTASNQTIDEDSRETAEAASLDSDVIFRPSSRVVLPSSDVNIDFERRNKTKYGGFTMVTSVAHVWFNTFFEGRGPEQNGAADDSGVFEIEWDAMDGLKGSSRKGTRAFDKFAVVWKAVVMDRKPSVTILEPAEGETVQQAEPADWRGTESTAAFAERKLGMRKENEESAAVSRASSLDSHQDGGSGDDSADELDGVKSDVRGGSEGVSAQATDGAHDLQHHKTAPSAPEANSVDVNPTTTVPEIEGDSVIKLSSGMRHVSTSKLPGGRVESDLPDDEAHHVGSIAFRRDTEASS